MATVVAQLQAEQRTPKRRIPERALFAAAEIGQEYRRVLGREAPRQLAHHLGRGRRRGAPPPSQESELPVASRSISSPQARFRRPVGVTR